MEIDRSDLQKILDVLVRNADFHKGRDQMNAAAHLARETRFSPLTSETFAAVERLDAILTAAPKEKADA